MGPKFKRGKKPWKRLTLNKKQNFSSSSPDSYLDIPSTKKNDKSFSSNDSLKENKKKKMQTPSLIQSQMAVTKEEMEYRKTKENEFSDLTDTSDMFKCTKCEFNFERLITKHGLVTIHPLMDVLMCTDCCDYYGDGNFSLDSDNEDKYCRWCGEGGTILTCSKCICGFCSKCIKKHFGSDMLKKIKKEDDWLCYFCNPKPLWHLRFICSFAKQKCTSQMERSRDQQEKVTKTERRRKKIENDDNENLSYTPKAKRKGPLWSKHRVQSSESEESDVEERRPKRRKTVTASFYYSSDEAEEEGNQTKSKRIKAVEKLKELLKLSQYQTCFSGSWTKKKLKDLREALKEADDDRIKKECQKIKWYFSTVASYFIGFCNSVDTLERDFTKIESKTAEETTENSDARWSYLPILKFLEFIKNEVDIFSEKGISLNDLFASEVYDDNNVIGLRKKSDDAENNKETTNSPRETRENSEMPESNAADAEVEEKTRDGQATENMSLSPNCSGDNSQRTSNGGNSDGDSDSDRPLHICTSEDIDQSLESNKSCEEEAKTPEKSPTSCKESGMKQDLEKIIEMLKSP